MREYRVYQKDGPEIAIAYLYADKVEESNISWKFFIGSTMIACIWKGGIIDPQIVAI